MTATWTLTTTAAGHTDTVRGTAGDAEAAVTAVLAAALDAIGAARACGVTTLPRYELHANAALVAVIQTGTDEAGYADHAAAATLISRIETERSAGRSPG